MNERLKLLRKTLHLTQQQFADRLRVPRNTIGGYEVGKSNPSDAAVNNICREFNVSEQWLRTGEGEIFLDQDDEYPIKRLAAMLAALDVSDWEVLLKMVQSLQ